MHLVARRPPRAVSTGDQGSETRNQLTGGLHRNPKNFRGLKLEVNRSGNDDWPNIKRATGKMCSISRGDQSRCEGGSRTMGSPAYGPCRLLLTFRVGQAGGRRRQGNGGSPGAAVSRNHQMELR